MPITLKAFAVQTEWEGCTWSVASIDELANAIAIIAVGQARHVATILHAAGLGPKPSSKAAINSGIKLLTHTGNIGHRDGWMFQVMSWLAAQIREPGALMNMPHLIHAHKGLDGLQVRVAGTNAVNSVVLFEDKATENPRSVVTAKVWPEFDELEMGHNENLITAEVAQLLALHGHPNPQQAVADVMWNQVRRFRLSITDEQSTDESQSKLFKGYAAHVPGALERRRAEVFEVTGLRAWMDNLAAVAIEKAKSFPTSD